MAIQICFPGRIIFDHLPKTAGVAINSWLSEALGSGSITPTVNGNHRDLIRKFGGDYAIISGHMQYFDDEPLDPRYQYLTVLREPLDRVLSWLYFVINNHDDTQIPHLRAAVTRFLESEGDDLPDLIASSISNTYVEHFSRIDHGAPKKALSADENAVRAVKQYNVVGIYEQMERFVTEVSSCVGIKSSQSLTRLNATNQRLDVGQAPRKLIDRLKQINQLDLRLYDEIYRWKASIPEKRFLAMGPSNSPLWKKFEPSRQIRTCVNGFQLMAVSLVEGPNVEYGAEITFNVDFHLHAGAPDLEMGIVFHDEDGQWAFGTNNVLLGRPYKHLPSGSHRVCYKLIATLPEGKYSAGFAFTELLSGGRRRGLAWQEGVYDFRVMRGGLKPFVGYAYLETKISLLTEFEVVANLSHN